MSQFAFGAGNCYGLVSSGGILVPRKFGGLTDVAIDFASTIKPFFGQFQYPIAFGKGQTKITGKASFGKFNGAMLNDLFFSGANASGQTVAQLGEAGAIPATPGPYTFQVAQHTTFVDDLQVVYTATGVPLTRVPSGPAQGQYSVASGTYTFAAADQGLAVVIDYTYTTTGGNTTTMSNMLTGSAPTFITVVPFTFGGKNLLMHLNSCVSEKLSLASKAEDFLVPQFDFMAGADASGVVGYISLAE